MDMASRGGPALQVSAIVPFYEEAGALDWVVDRTLRALERACGEMEVILVVHASARDGTPALAATRAQKDPRLRVVVQPAGPRGYGRALALGLEAARLPWVFLCDGDGQFDPVDFPRLAAAAAGVDLAAGVRAPRADPWPRRLAARIYNALLRLLLGVPLRDADCAFKLFRRQAVGGTLKHRHLADGELVARLLSRGGRWREVEVPHRARRAGRSQAEGRAGFPRLSLVVAVMGEMLRLRRELRRPRRHARAGPEKR